MEARLDQSAEFREQAEEILRQRPTFSIENIEALSSDAILQGFHELHVHQIELERQNEELRRTQNELYASTARYFDFYNLAPVGYLTTSDLGLILEANLTITTLLAVTHSTCINRPISQFIFKEDQDIYYLHCKKLIETGEPQACDLRMMNKDKKALWMRLNSTVAHDIDGAPLCKVVLSDITEHKQMENTLRKSEEQFRKLFEHHSAVKLVLDPETGDIIDANEAAAQFYGWPIKELKQMRIQQINLLPFEAVKVEMEKAASLKKTSFEFRHQKADGSIREVEVFSNKIEIAGRKLIYSIIHDITERKQAEEALRKNQEEMLNILDSSPVMIFFKDCENKFVFVNKLLAEVTGLPREAMEGKTGFEIFPNLAQKYWDDDMEVIVSGKPKIGIIETIDTATGQRWVQTDKILYRDNEGRIIGIIGFAIDITERKHAEEQLQSINNELEQRVELRTQELQESQKQYLHAEKLAAIGQLSASIAHEFNNPLQGILSILKGLKKRAILENEDRELLVAAIDEGDRIKDLIRNLQDFNRPSSGRKAEMDVHYALDSILILQKSDFNGRRISVVRDYAKELPLILAVADQIKQVFLNLLTNAADACYEHDCVIMVSTRLEKDKVAVAIKDNGVGIKLEEMEHIFRPFFTTKAEVKGTGLGLSVSYGIVKKHHGEIRVDSQPGEGATFTVLLPIKGPEESALATDR